MVAGKQEAESPLGMAEVWRNRKPAPSGTPPLSRPGLLFLSKHLHRLETKSSNTGACWGHSHSSYYSYTQGLWLTWANEVPVSTMSTESYHLKIFFLKKYEVVTEEFHQHHEIIIVI